MTATDAQDTPQLTAAAVARRLYGFRPTAVTRFPSENNHVFRVDFGGLPAKVVKLPGRVASLLREQRVVRSVRFTRWGMRVPAIEFTQEDLPERDASDAAWERPAAVTVMRCEPGLVLVDAILRDEPWVGDAMRAAGAFAAQLGEVPPMRLGRARLSQPPEQVERSLRWVQPALEAFDLGRLSPLLEEVGRMKARPAVSLVHGEYYPENLLASSTPGGTHICVLDWETARPGFAAQDLASLVGAIIDLPLRDDGRGAWLRRRAIEGFGALHPLAGPGMHELAAWEAFGLLSGARFHLDAGRIERARRLARQAAIVYDS